MLPQMFFRVRFGGDSRSGRMPSFLIEGFRVLLQFPFLKRPLYDLDWSFWASP